MENISDFGQRANIHHFKVNDKDVVLYDDHRILFSILFDMQKYGFVETRPDLIYFDYHNDCAIRDGLSIADRRAFFGNSPITHIHREGVWGYGEFKLSMLDDNWLTAAMDLNWVRNAVVVGVEQQDNIEALNERYRNEQDEHHLYTLRHLDDETDVHGRLGDRMQQGEDIQYLRELFGYGEEQDGYPYILDFDLDCFTMECCGKTMAWPRDIFCERYVENMKVCGLMKKLITGASLITICREPECCGGLGESHKILSYLDAYFFDGQLKTQPIQ